MAQLAQPIGEAWMTGNDSVFANGPCAGRKLGEAWPEMPVEWRGTSIRHSAVFPILTKFIFAEEKLSIQVHPDDEYASKHEGAAGGVGKTEMWYTLAARPGAEVLAGLKPEVTREGFQQAMADGTTENCLQHVPLSEGDAIFIPARTAHTIGAGLVLCEIQQHSDITYRVFDYNRRDASGRTRELHIDKALAVMRFGAQDCGKLQPAHYEQAGAKESFFIACRYFSAERWDFASPISRTTSRERFDLLIVLNGSGRIVWSGGEAEFGTAQAWLFPAALGTYQLKPASYTSLLKTFVPGDSMNFDNYFAERGVSRKDWARLIR
ncbi:MAG TPA: type I phosphomannose isomerase catalytic subunit [Candidatus Acidoferrales bacterium]|nr:type I phosphomannose isomerase catalytic subunit [Candidatus Acidoferrales bacterium]